MRVRIRLTSGISDLSIISCDRGVTWCATLHRLQFSLVELSSSRIWRHVAQSPHVSSCPRILFNWSRAYFVP
eukprot:6251810-Amphidinium_carterae.1